MSREQILETPLSSEEIRRLSVGDMVYLRGEIIMMKTPGYARALDLASRGENMPVAFNGAAIYHGFTALKEEEGGLRTHYLGPTLSYRYSELAPRMISELGVKAFIGKMGASMSDETLTAMKEYTCIHLGQIGGVTAYNSHQLEGPIKAFWTDILGERCLLYRANSMGPLIVSMDSRGQSLFVQVEQQKRVAIRQILS
ncbi:MAG: fumarate hydratase C-terminal domain-containing protein [Pseudomonadota bacterium]